MSNEKNCWCLYCTAGYTFSCVAETADILREFEKENKALKAEVEALKKEEKTTHEKNCLYCEENKLLKVRISALEHSNEILEKEYAKRAAVFEKHFSQVRALEKENKALKAEVETLKKDNEELSDIYCQRNLILSEENQKLNREIKRLTDWNISLNKRFVEEAYEEDVKESEFKVGDLVYCEPFQKNGRIVEVSCGDNLKIKKFRIKLDNFLVWVLHCDITKSRWQTIPNKDLKIGDKVKVEFEGLITSSYPNDNLCPDGYFVVENKQGGESWLVRSKYVTKTEG